jgi:hypothetical protein
MEWLPEQPVFFVATAPLGKNGRINLSPKGLAGSFAVLDSTTVAYLDLTGSGVETIAHLKENGRIVLMFCAFSGRPNIVRLYGEGQVLLPQSGKFTELRGRFFERDGARAIILISVDRVSESCGWGVPEMSYEGDREVLDLFSANKGPDGLADYRQAKNSISIDGLPGL